MRTTMAFGNFATALYHAVIIIIVASNTLLHSALAYAYY